MADLHLKPMPEDWSRAVAVVAHPDDLEYGTAAALVGVRQAEFLDYADGVVEYGLPLRRDLAAAFRRLRPDVGAGVEYAVGLRRYPMG